MCRGHVAGKTVLSSTMRWNLWVCAATSCYPLHSLLSFFPHGEEHITNVLRVGHCWADTSINYSQLTVPQGPSVIRASEIVINFFDSM